MSVRKVKTKNGEIKWEVRYRLAGRNSQRVARRFDTRADAEAHEFARKLDAKNGTAPLAVQASTFKVEAEHWLNFHRQRFSASHLQNVSRFLQKMLPDYGHLSPDRFHPGLLGEIQSKFLSDGLKASSVNRHLQVIIAILNFALRQRRISINPTIGYHKLKEIRDEVSFWEKEETLSFLQFIHAKYPPDSKERWVYIVYLLAINTALRAGEIWGLKPSDLRPQSEVILVQRQFNRALKDFSPTKGKKNRRVPCNINLLNELQSWIRSKGIRDDEPIFQNGAGQPIGHDNFIKRQFVRDLRDWGGKRIRFHDLRHTGTTLMIASGVDLKTAQEICGHENIKTTMGYTHLLAERIRETARSFVIAPV